MQIFEANKFARLREKLKSAAEREELKKAIMAVAKEPAAGKKLKGEFKELRSFRYTVKGQARRLIYHWESPRLTLLSFGPREGIYK